MNSQSPTLIFEAHPKTPKILIGTPIHQSKDYAMERWLQNVAKLQQEYPADLLLVDNSPNLEYVEKVAGYCRKYAIQNYKIDHLDIGDLQTRDEKIARSREIIRQEILNQGYDAWFSWESDQIIPSNTLTRLVKIMEAGNYMMVHPNSWSRMDTTEPDADFGICLINYQPLEKYTFLLDTPELRNSWAAGEAWFKRQVIAGGGSYIEVYGLIKPITHLNE